MLPSQERDEIAQKSLVARVNEITSAETGRWLARHQNLASGSQNLASGS